MNTGKDKISLYLRTDLKGIILISEGRPEEYFDTNIMAGDLIEQFIPFSGLYPVKHHQLNLPNIQTKKNVWVNIYIEKNAEHIYILIEDNTEEALRLQEKVQQNNQEQLNKSNHKNEQ